MVSRKNRLHLLPAIIGLSAGVLLPAAIACATGEFYSDRCVPIFSDDDWKVATTGSGYGRLVTRPAGSGPWGSVIPNSRAQWLYSDNFDTGPVRSSNQYTAIRFEKQLGSQLQPPYNLESAYIRVTGDNGYVLYVTGTKVGATFDTVYNSFLPSADWRNYQTYDILPALRAGANSVTVDVYDFGGAAGFLLDGEICAKSGFSQAVPIGSSGGGRP